jgi:hypothetical protein
MHLSVEREVLLPSITEIAQVAQVGFVRGSSPQAREEQLRDGKRVAPFFCETSPLYVVSTFQSLVIPRGGDSGGGGAEVPAGDSVKTPRSQDTKPYSPPLLCLVGAFSTSRALRVIVSFFDTTLFDRGGGDEGGVLPLVEAFSVDLPVRTLVKMVGMNVLRDEHALSMLFAGAHHAKVTVTFTLGSKEWDQCRELVRYTDPISSEEEKSELEEERKKKKKETKKKKREKTSDEEDEKTSNVPRRVKVGERREFLYIPPWTNDPEHESLLYDGVAAEACVDFMDAPVAWPRHRFLSKFPAQLHRWSETIARTFDPNHGEKDPGVWTFLASFEQ